MVKETSIKKGLVYLVQVNDNKLGRLLSRTVNKENLRLESVENSANINEQRPDGKIIAFIIGNEVQDPVQSAQRLHAVEESAAIIILSKPEAIESLKVAIKYSPFIGTDVYCLDESKKARLETKLDEILRSSHQSAKYREVLADSNPKISLKASSQKSAFNKNFVTKLMDITPIGIAIVGRWGNVTGWNKKAASIFDTNESQILGKPLSQLFEHSEAIQLEKYLDKSLKKRNTGENNTLSLERKTNDKPRQVLNITAAPFYAEETEKALILAIKDVTENVDLLSRLKKEVESRDNFLSMASHELRTPLTAMRFNLELLRAKIQKENLPGTSDILELNNKSLDQTEHLNELIEDLFDIAKVHSGKLDFDMEKFNLSEFVKNYLAEIEQKFDEVHTELELDIEPNVVGVWDKGRVEQAFSNLLSNLFKYAPQAPVKITLKTKGKWAHLSVIDQGPGIPKEQQEKIFERFERAGANKTISGLGIGLFITKKIVEGHTGKVEVQSSPGEGSTFTLKLPMDLDPENPPENLGVLW